MLKLRTLALSLTLVCAVAGGAIASPGDAHDNDQGQGHDNHQGNGYGHHKSNSVPELDPSAAGAAMILLIGGTLVLLERRRSGFVLSEAR
jgi:hypothetical protein